MGATTPRHVAIVVAGWLGLLAVASAPARAEAPVQFTGPTAQPPPDSAPAAGWEEVASRIRFFRPSTFPFGSATLATDAPPVLTADLFDGERIDYSMEQFSSDRIGVRSWVGSPVGGPAHPAARLIITVTSTADGTDLLGADVWDLEGVHHVVFVAGDGVYGMARIDEATLPGDGGDDTLEVPGSSTSSSTSSSPPSPTRTTPLTTTTIDLDEAASRRPSGGRSGTGWLWVGLPLLLLGAAASRHLIRRHGSRTPPDAG